MPSGRLATLWSIAFFPFRPGVRIAPPSAREVGDPLVDRLFHLAAERQDVAAVAHGDGEADRRLAVDAEHRLRRIGITAPDGRNVSQPDQPAIGQEIDVEEVRFRSEGAGNAEQNLLVASLERPRGTDRVLSP